MSSDAGDDILTRSFDLVLRCRAENDGDGREGLDGEFLDVDAPERSKDTTRLWRIPTYA